MEVRDDEVKNVICSKNFKKFVVWAKSWANALYYFSRLLAELESGKTYNEKQVSKKLIELKIPAALKKQTISISDVEDFFMFYKMWAYDNGFSEPRQLTGQRVVKIKAILRNYSQADINQVFFNAQNSKFIKENNFFSIDWITKLGNFIKVLEGNYSDRSKGLLGDF